MEVGQVPVIDEEAGLSFSSSKPKTLKPKPWTLKRGGLGAGGACSSDGVDVLGLGCSSVLAKCTALSRCRVQGLGF